MAVSHAKLSPLCIALLSFKLEYFVIGVLQNRVPKRHKRRNLLISQTRGHNLGLVPVCCGSKRE